MTQAPHILSSFLNQTTWVFGSSTVIAISGAILLFCVAAFNGSEGIGIFNQLYALYIIFGQLFVVGLNDSVLKHAAEYREDPDQLETVLTTALISAIAVGLFGSVITYMLAQPLARIMDSPQVGRGIVFIAPALCLFVINKVLASFVNGVQRISYFAITQSIRSILLVVSIIIISINDLPPSYFGIAFIGAEAGVIILFIPIIIKASRFKINQTVIRTWAGKHLAFGLRALPHGLLSESFFRIDILVLAIFLSDSEVGIYSFIAFFAEGLLQITYVVRVVTTPHLVRIMTFRNISALRNLAIKSITSSIIATIAAAIVIIITFPLIETWFPLVKDPRSLQLLTILLAGVCVYALFAPFENIFLSAGHPDLQSLFIAIITLTNIVLNFSLVPHLGLPGAAIATAVTFFVSSVTLNILAFKFFHIHLWK